MADGVTECEILPKGQDGDDGERDGHGPGRSEEDESDDDRNENKCGENASAGHSVGQKA